MELLVVSLIDVSCTKFHQATAGAALVQSPDANATLDQSVIIIGGLSPRLFIVMLISNIIKYKYQPHLIGIWSYFIYILS